MVKPKFYTNSMFNLFEEVVVSRDTVFTFNSVKSSVFLVVG